MADMQNPMAVNPWMGALQGALGSLRMTGSQPYSQAGFGNALGAGMDQGMAFYQMAMQNELMKRKVREEEKNKLVWEQIGAEALKGDKPDLMQASKALIAGGTPETIKAGLALQGQLAGAEIEAKETKERRAFEERIWDKRIAADERIAKMRNPLAGFGGDFVEPDFGAPAPAAAPAPAPAPAARATAPSAPAPGPMGPPDLRAQSYRYPVAQPESPMRYWEMLQQWRQGARQKYDEYLKKR